MHSSSDPIDRYRWPAVLPNSFYPVTNITNEENSCNLNSSLPVNRWNQSIISLYVHHAYLNIAQNKWVYSTQTHRAGVAGNFFSMTLYKSVLIGTCQNCLYFGRFFSGNFLRHFLCSVGIFCHLILYISNFSLILKGFNIGQENVVYELKYVSLGWNLLRKKLVWRLNKVRKC